MNFIWRFIKARWRWHNNRCPLCSRKLDAEFKYYIVGYKNCPCCMANYDQWETESSLYLWRRYRTLTRGIRLVDASR
jgi:hypothetical protein